MGIRIHKILIAGAIIIAGLSSPVWAIELSTGGLAIPSQAFQTAWIQPLSQMIQIGSSRFDGLDLKSDALDTAFNRASFELGEGMNNAVRAIEPTVVDANFSQSFLKLRSDNTKTNAFTRRSGSEMFNIRSVLCKVQFLPNLFKPV